MQKWEYKLVLRTRGWERNKGLLAEEGFHSTGWNLNIEEMLPGLGNDGWELVAVTPRSGNYGQTWAGMTNEELWVFKRPKLA